MRSTLTAITLALSGVALGGSTAAPAQGAALPAPLLPLGDGDTRTGEYGCESSFAQGNATYVYLINRQLRVRTAPGAAGLHSCAIGQDAADGFGNGPTSVSCGGRTLVVRPYGRSHGSAEADSVASPATLTMSAGGHSRTVRGEWGTAC